MPPDSRSRHIVYQNYLCIEKVIMVYPMRTLLYALSSCGHAGILAARLLVHRDLEEMAITKVGDA